ncbi:MAG: hypothetical protein P4L61_03915 [Candidatus Pacebacteria bacterium]|nr:hypothetical protein [Candidatus Paceibacterota bacterium]
MKSLIIYIARDIERALGALPSPDYRIVANDSPYARSVKEKYPNFILLIESSAPLDTFDLLEKEETAAFIEKAAKENAAQGIPDVLVFKSTSRIEELCEKKGWKLLNPSTALAEKIENKITQAEWLGELATLLPSFVIAPAKDIKWGKKTLVLQFAHAHTGLGTVLVNTEKELQEIQKQFPDRPVKASEFIKGPTFTVNMVTGSAQADTSFGELPSEPSRRELGLGNPGIARRKNVSAGALQSISIGNPSYQITGMPPLTDSPFATIGNDWSLPHSILNERLLGEFRDIAEKIGAKMSESGWRGLFGIDVIYDEERDQFKLIEINARQPASTTYESQLQAKFRGHGLAGATIFEAHLAALTGSPLTENQIEINDGAQIVQRVAKNSSKGNSWTEKIAALNKAGYATIPYSNTKPNSDFLRIQSDRDLMESHGKFNKRGQEIIDIIEK